MITAWWLENLIARHETKERAEARAKGYAEGLAQARREKKIRDEAHAQGRAEVLELLDADTRKEVERELRLIHDIRSEAIAEGVVRVLRLLDDETRMEAERKLGLNRHSED